MVAVQGVCAIAAIQVVNAGPAQKRVVSQATPEHVITITAVQGVCAVTTSQPVITSSTP